MPSGERKMDFSKSARLQVSNSTQTSWCFRVAGRVWEGSFAGRESWASARASCTRGTERRGEPLGGARPCDCCLYGRVLPGASERAYEGPGSPSRQTLDASLGHDRVPAPVLLVTLRACWK